MCARVHQEDEVHFVTACPTYQPLRDGMLARVAAAEGLASGEGMVGGGALANDEAQFAALLSSRERAVITAVARFVYHAWRLRQQQQG